MSVPQIKKNKRLYSLRMFCSSDHFLWKARRQEELLWADLILGLPTPPYLLEIQKEAPVFSKMVATTALRVPGLIPALFQHTPVSSWGTLWIFSELPSCRAEHRVQIFLPVIWLLSNVFFLSLRVIKVHLMLLPVPWTLLWSTSDPLQRLSTTRTGRCCSWGLRSTEVCPPTRDTLPTKTLKDCDRLACCNFKLLYLRNQPRISIMLWTLWGNEMHHLHADGFTN